jgi:hypothetical protein
MGRTAKEACPACGAKFRAAALLPSQAELKKLQREGVTHVGDPPEQMDCPKCRVPLKVVSVRMGTFFTAE